MIHNFLLLTSILTITFDPLVCVRMRDCESLTCENYYFIYTFHYFRCDALDYMYQCL